MHVHRAWNDMDVVPPHGCQQLLAREYPPGAAQKVLQELVLDPTEMDAALPTINAMRIELYHNVGKAEYVCAALQRGAKQITQPSDEFARGKRFQQTVRALEMSRIELFGLHN